MTCVVALIDGERVFMGADSAGVGGYSLQVRRDRKIYRVGAMIIGFTTSFRMGQLLGYSLSLPLHHSDVTVERYMATAFIDAVRSCLKTGGFAKSENGVESGGDFIVAYQRRLFIVHSDYQIAETTNDYAAVGCGFDLALGSLHTSGSAKARSLFTAEERVRLALEAADTFSAGVCAPYYIEELALERSA